MGFSFKRAVKKAAKKAAKKAVETTGNTLDVINPVRIGEKTIKSIKGEEGGFTGDDLLDFLGVATGIEPLGEVGGAFLGGFLEGGEGQQSELLAPIEPVAPGPTKEEVKKRRRPPGIRSQTGTSALSRQSRVLTPRQNR